MKFVYKKRWFLCFYAKPRPDLIELLEIYLQPFGILIHHFSVFNKKRTFKMTKPFKNFKKMLFLEVNIRSKIFPAHGNTRLKVPVLIEMLVSDNITLLSNT